MLSAMEWMKIPDNLSAKIPGPTILIKNAANKTSILAKP